MAAMFKRLGRDRIRVRLGLDEVAVLRGLPEQLRAVLTEGADDPVHRRLFPPAYLEPEDAERDAEYRRLMHDELVQGKLANLEVVTGTLDRGSSTMRRWTVDLTAEEAAAWLGVLNDLRLTLGVRLDITEDFDGQVDDADPRAPGMHLLSFLGWMEEHLLEALSSA